MKFVSDLHVFREISVTGIRNIIFKTLFDVEFIGVKILFCQMALDVKYDF